ncbi:OmpA family protein [Erythrobacter arachoides]|uniref:OmpA family protein n=1 Tax=Aurantiacibacter arachoides TaxID=1850444 RepID=A0A845A2C9_9SPHN|nr:OmpA family protein [Aurantiacibacter arachoides]MXO94713.1 OmpA family protein [Aurantiacibacter arachoides]GGD61229.1 cell envelope biogenesis protein OmpA [Aurantiacibacter arachoides]
MKFKKLLVTSAAGLALVGATSACVTDPNTGNQVISRTAIGGLGGAGLGYLLGGLIGGKTARIVGAGIGGAAGGYVGYRMDEQIREIEEVTSGTGVNVGQTPNGDGILVTFPDVTFATNQATISPSMRNVLDGVAQSMINYPNSLIDVMGHTDATGSDQYNLDLSRRRAESVANYLTSRGVARTRMETIGYGEQYPVADNTSESGRAQNRRVEIRITPVTQADVNSAY